MFIKKYYAVLFFSGVPHDKNIVMLTIHHYSMLASKLLWAEWIPILADFTLASIPLSKLVCGYLHSLL